MTQEKMTVHRALAELKTMDDRIRSAISGVKYVIAAKHSAEKINGVTVVDFKENIKSCYQKAKSLMARRDAMKRAVVLSNATTKVMVGNVEYTVAEAIEMKNHGVEYKKILRQCMVNDWNMARMELERNSGEAIEKRAEQYVLSVIAAQPKDAKMAVDSEAMKALRKDFIANNTYDLIDPLNLSKEMETLMEEINEFETEVDAALSVSNAVTVIEFEY